MVSNFYKLYPQYQVTADRRQQSVPVVQERRSGKDRRTEERVALPSNIKRDLYRVKAKCENTFAVFKSKQSDKDEMLPYLKNVVEHKQKEAVKREFLNAITSPVPMMRRLVNIKNNKEDENPVKAVGLTAIAAINAKEDARDLLSIIKRVDVMTPKNGYARYGFFVGTTIEDFAKKINLGEELHCIDITIGHTKFGNVVKKILNQDIEHNTYTKAVNHFIGKEENLIRKCIVFSSKCPKIKRTIILALYRMPVLSLLVAGLLELPSIFKAKKQDKFKQTTNSALNVVCGATCGALFSAAASVFLPPITPGIPVMALGVGYYIGSKIAKAINFKLEKSN